MRFVRKVWTVFAVAGVVVLLPLIVPIAIALHAVRSQRLRSAANRFACAGCGAILGKESLRLADVKWAKRVEEMRIKYPRVKFRVVRDVDAICSKCGKQYGYVEKTRGFEEVFAKTEIVGYKAG